MDESTGYSSCFYIFLFLVLGKVLPTVEKYSPYEGGLANTVGWLKEGFLFPDKVTDRDTVKTESSRYNKPWSSYPPPIPLWAITKPRRDFLPFFGYYSSSTHHPPSPPTISSPTSAPFTTSSATPSSISSTTASAVTCRPDPVNDNLPLECIQIIDF